MTIAGSCNYNICTSFRIIENGDYDIAGLLLNT